ncbi:hypothetical protein AOY20_05930 [Acinetobacter equi]|uniref:Uncharacterized protein n=1 Tax=Acinetobacter equi TaxID=1324350 RepID=A0A0N7GXM3_9GAMM|nr:hypothetical protein AOY20_05930 [Acinetobacter equi]
MNLTFILVQNKQLIASVRTIKVCAMINEKCFHLQLLIIIFLWLFLMDIKKHAKSHAFFLVKLTIIEKQLFYFHLQ